MNQTRLSKRDIKLLQAYADETACDYCAGCGNICETAVHGQIPISDIMRYLMYYRSYGERDRARALFRALPHETRQRLETVDFAAAERRCPQKMAICHIMRTAARTLT
jgi:predicted aldo/keto reductase-like oxidoreductase